MNLKRILLILVMCFTGFVTFMSFLLLLSAYQFVPLIKDDPSYYIGYLAGSILMPIGFGWLTHWLYRKQKD